MIRTALGSYVFAVLTRATLFAGATMLAGVTLLAGAAMLAGATVTGCTRQSAGTAENTTQAASAKPVAAVPNIQPTSAPNEPPPAELNDESAGVKDPPGEDPSGEPSSDDEANEDYE